MEGLRDFTITEEDSPKIHEVYGSAPDTTRGKRELTDEEKAAWEALRNASDPY